MSGSKRHNDSADQGDNGKRSGCLWLILLGIAFIVLVFGIIIYSITRDQTAEVQANEVRAIQACWVKANDPSATPTSRAFATDSCKEMEKQFRIKYGREPE
ncbi:hypothetical protein [Phytopseudomonas dryadis]|uniref:Uncharacterized protein n=1 Tax=Phytopseudomonas dryadis TaxID=2487520 RepID=A0A4V2KCV1_9GAMM|nr:MULTISPECIES: hypothetical protein [Pseudomonas]TBU96367.1 hypothetical protein DNK44_04245 [Pseudomonas dryadis]TBV00897.1 hypothetical protein DNK34_22530 [Pseudomonas dryadis]TBV13558.1 hypothetical protein DNK41_22060 [Pseudomonas sp. FRB 230]